MTELGINLDLLATALTFSALAFLVLGTTFFSENEDEMGLRSVVEKRSLMNQRIAAKGRALVR